jgi:hypothetical protein
MKTLGMVMWVERAIEVAADGTCTFVPDPFARPKLVFVLGDDARLNRDETWSDVIDAACME